MREGWLNCRVCEGQFSNEYGIESESFDHTRFTLFAPTQLVETNSMQVAREFGPGRVRVRMLGSEGAKVWIQLPGETFEMGSVVLVNLEQLTSIKQLQEA
jgi:hypothetical protein